MDDTCVVCADTLEWSAYGACGHKDVCSTCVTRLRFICDDRRCCICKTESHVVFVTKALGDYTKTISDFSLFPSELKEGRVGNYWYHEDTEALFDDLEHYKMIKAMCKLSCSVCDKIEDQPGDPSRRIRFRSIEQLKGHLFHKHKLFMCNLCLEGRKVFICEQKLYTRPQLTRHTNTGDSEADGPESERDGFTGHPICEFCRNPFYGDNELYLHMSTEHYTCHICQRRHPGQYEYYKNYDELEMHFRHDHFLCEDEGCLGKKFIVFPSEAELKRHNTLEHGGHMSRSQRSAALQLPTSFRYRRSSERANRRERGYVFEPDPSESELSLAIQASLQTVSSTASSSQSNNDPGDTADVESNFPPLDSSAATLPARSSRYLQAASHGSINGGFRESSFPPLAMASGSNRPTSLQAASHGSVNGGLGGSFPPLARPSGSKIPNSQAIPKKNLAARLRSKNNGKPKVLVSSLQPTVSHAPQNLATDRDAWPSLNVASGSGQSSGVSEATPPLNGHSLSSQSRPPSVPYSSVSASSSSSGNSGITRKIIHSSSAPNLSGPEFIRTSSEDFPPVSAAHNRKAPILHQTLAKVENVHSANKSLVEKMRAALGHDDDKFTAFRDISGDYRQGLMDSKTYIAYVDQFGLSHLVLELARLLPDVEKQKELVESYNSSLMSNEPRENLVDSKDPKVSKNGKGKAVDSSSSTSTVTEMRSRYVNSEEEVEVLSKDGYRRANGKSKMAADDLRIGLNPSSASTTPQDHIQQAVSLGTGTDHSSSKVEVKGKQKKKTSKFLRARLGDGAVEEVLDLTKTDLDDEQPKEASAEGSATRGVWKNSGGRKLVAAVTRKPRN